MFTFQLFIYISNNISQDDPGSTLGFQQNPTNHQPFWRTEGNIVQRVHNAVSLEMAYG
jgi:hypothetical protein